MKPIKINFADFWPGFIKDNNFFYNLLSQKYQVTISDNPDFIFYSCYGNEYLKYNCVRIFYSSENIRPDFTGCDYAITFDFNDHPRHYRLPLYGLYYKAYIDDFGMKDLLQPPSQTEAEEIWKSKSKFCCMVVSNGKAKKRIDFFHKLSRHLQVDSGGRYLNNVGKPIGGTVMDKLKFIEQYKFVFSFENSSYAGYTTEKILEPFFVNSIPIYWGNPLVGKDFNKGRFIDYSDFKTEDDLIQFILEVNNNDKLAIDILTKPVFPANKVPEYNRVENVSIFLDGIIDEIQKISPVAITQRVLHLINRNINKVKSYSDNFLGKAFR